MVNDKEVVVELKNITKKFGNFIANENISFKLLKGQVHAILGENGAGKSTLMNQLFGLLQPTSGEIYVHGKLKKFSSSKDAMNEGIGMVHQHFMLIETFTVTENIVLGFEPEKGITLDMEKAKKMVNEISKKYNFKIDPTAKICDITVEMQQKVEILKALVRGADILIFDEPTACLTPNEIDKFMENIKKLTKDGKSIIIITHKLKEIKKCADVCTIIRNGKYIDTVNVKDKSEDELAELMVGRKVVLDINKSSHPDLDVVLEVKNVFAKDYRKIDILKKISFVVKKGEILGLAGIDGNGQAELVDVITGIKKATSGEVLLNGENIINTTPKNCFEKGVSSIPADRQKRGLILDFEVRENMILQNYQTKEFSKNGILDNKKIDFFTNKAIEKYDIRPKDCINKLASTLSGGNQQKIIIAREVENNKDLLIAYNPTRGLDVGAIEFVHKYLVEQREKNKAILLVSYDLEEILTLSDRILVIFDGKIVGNILSKDANGKKLGILMAGGVL